MENKSNILESNDKWHPVRWYEGLYEVTKSGIVRRLPRPSYRKKCTEVRIINPVLMKNGYYAFTLIKDGVEKKIYKHRILAVSFIPNPLGKREVNHIDGNKQNNLLSNLEWVTTSENGKHAYKLRLKNPAHKKGHFKNFNGRAKPVLQFTKEGVFIAEYPGISAASRASGDQHNKITRGCAGRNIVSVYKWAFK